MRTWVIICGLRKYGGWSVSFVGAAVTLSVMLIAIMGMINNVCGADVNGY